MQERNEGTAPPDSTELDETRKELDEKFSDDAEKQIDDEEDASPDTEGQGNKSQEGEVAESYTYSDGGGGQLYVTKTDTSSETTPSEVEHEEDQSEYEEGHASEPEASTEQKSTNYEETEQSHSEDEPTSVSRRRRGSSGVDEADEEEPRTGEQPSKPGKKRARQEAEEDSEEAQADTPDTLESCQESESHHEEPESETDEDQAEGVQDRADDHETEEYHSDGPDEVSEVDDSIEDTRPVDASEQNDREDPQSEVESSVEGASDELAEDPVEDAELSDVKESELEPSQSETDPIEPAEQDDTVTEETPELQSEDEEYWEDYEEYRSHWYSERPEWVDAGFPEAARRRSLMEWFSRLPDWLQEALREQFKAALDSEEELEKLLKRFPELSEREDAEEREEEARKYIRLLTELRRAGDKELGEDEIKELAEELDVDPEQVLRWAHEEEVPQLITDIRNAEGLRRLEAWQRRLFEGPVPESDEEIDDVLGMLKELREHPEFARWERQLRTWMQVMAAKSDIPFVVEGGKTKYHIPTVEQLSRELRVPTEVILSWLRGERRPSLLDLARSMPSYYEALALVRQHPHAKRKNSPERYEEYEKYLAVMQSPPEASSKELAEQYELDRNRVVEWRMGLAEPRLVRYVRNSDATRVKHELTVTPEAMNHRLDPTEVRKLLKELAFLEDDLEELLEQLVRMNPDPESCRVWYAELYKPGSPLTEDRLRTVARVIRADREVLEQALNRRLGLDDDPSTEVRIAVTDDRLYFWYKSESPDLWLNVLFDQKFYFYDKTQKLALIDEAIRRLHVRGGGEVSEHYLNDILDQLSRVEPRAVNRTRRYGQRHHLDGETLHIFGDMTGRTLEDLTPMIAHMGFTYRGRVTNLRWPEIRRWRMRTVAIIMSDGHVPPNGELEYSEKDDERRALAIGVYQEFGDFMVKEYFGPEGDSVPRVRFPTPLANIMRFYGVPEGDKAIWNRGLHMCLVNETPEMKAYYLEEMVPEDGCFSNGRFSISRGHVLHAGDKAEEYGEKYGVKPVVTQEDIDFVKEHGESMPEELGYEEGERIKLKLSTLRKLEDDEDEETLTTAIRLMDIIKRNPNRLLKDEVDQIIRILGIKVSMYRDSLIYYIKTKRLSVSTKAYTTSKKAAIRWALLAPPNHPRKMRAVVKFLRENEKDVIEVKMKLEKDGLKVHPKWEEFDI